MTGPSLVRPWSRSTRALVELLRHLPERLREPAFWWIQAGVVGVTVLHIGTEAVDVGTGDHGFAAQLHHLPVTLYLIPVVAACYRYGMEGGMLTGLWCAILTLPNMLLWHIHEFEWLGELIFVLVVVGIGLVVARPVEREQQQRRRAEAIGRRLAFLNEAAATLSDTPHLAWAIERALVQLVSTLGLRGAAVAATDTSAEELVRVIHAAGGDARLLEALADSREAADVDGARVLPVMAQGLEIGRLAVLAGSEHPIEDEDGVLSAVAGQIGVAVDNAGLHRQEERRMRTYVQRVTRAQEEERHRIARDLHDDSVQQLIVLARELDTVAEECHQPDAKEHLRTLHEHTSEILAGLRRFSRDLRPAMLDELGLLAALDWVTGDLRSRLGVDITLDVLGPGRRLPGDVEVALFRIAQEAMHNVERHADATSVRVSVRFTPTEVEVQVVDDGIGFTKPEPDEPAQPTSLGLLGMQERAHLMGGQLRIDSRPGSGTEVTAHVPIQPPPAVEGIRGAISSPNGAVCV
jgi:signal transduction histidine kinase